MVERPRVKGKFAPSPHSYQHLLSYPQVKVWIDIYRSPNTRDNYLRALEFVTKSTGLTPDKLIKLSEGKAKEAVMGIVREYIQADKLMVGHILQTAMKGVL